MGLRLEFSVWDERVGFTRKQGFGLAGRGFGLCWQGFCDSTVRAHSRALEKDLGLMLFCWGLVVFIWISGRGPNAIKCPEAQAKQQREPARAENHRRSK